ncbi:hypothetical protein AMECASPLE_024922, partial [Ameca splendens]
ICDAQGEQPNIFQVEGQHSLQEVITEETLKSSTCSCYSIPCSPVTCVAPKIHRRSAESDSGLSSSLKPNYIDISLHCFAHVK